MKKDELKKLYISAAWQYLNEDSFDEFCSKLTPDEKREFMQSLIQGTDWANKVTRQKAMEMIAPIADMKAEESMAAQTLPFSLIPYIKANK